MSIPSTTASFRPAGCLALLSVLVFSGCTSERLSKQGEPAPQENTVSTEPVYKEVGQASWYGPGFHGNKTANGETFNQHKLTAAHPSLPLGTKAEVTNLENGKKVEVKINDRGPYAKDRSIDLSRAAAQQLGMTKDGAAQVKIEVKPDQKQDSVARNEP